MSRGPWSISSRLDNRHIGRSDHVLTQAWKKREPQVVPLPHVMPGLTKEMLMQGRARPAKVTP